MSYALNAVTFSRDETMRDANIIMQTTGDDPLTELMELDEFYGWTRRISILRSIFGKKKSVLPWFIGALFFLGFLCVGSYIVIVYIL